MGYMNARGMAEAVDRRTALGWHLCHNHYPPVPAVMIDACEQAIDAATDDDWERMIALPEGIAYRDETEAPAWAIIEGFHLDAFLDMEED